MLLSSYTKGVFAWLQLNIDFAWDYLSLCQTIPGLFSRVAGTHRHYSPSLMGRVFPVGKNCCLTRETPGYKRGKIWQGNI